ncbi:MAG: hypothetical protein IT383_17655 [Deltaproteobacteria bacterium]|nr:hypothetical protein [Deltaproteobacteria bacterium]
MRHALESFFKRRFFAVHLALLALAAILCARTATAIAGHMVAEQLKEKATAAKPAERRGAAKTGSTRDFLAAANANIFEGRREVVVQATASDGPAPDDGTCDTAGKSALRLRLVGTVVFATPEFSLASIVDEGKGGSAHAEMFSVNDCVSAPVDAEDPNAKLAPKPPPCSKIGDSATLRRIEAERACIWNESDHRMELLFIDEPPAKGGAVVARNDSPKAEAAPASPDDLGATIKKTGENSYEVGQSDIDKALNNLADLSTQARIVPAFEGGKTIGFKLFSIRPGSLYSKVGLQNGDVITRINGYEMTDPAKGLEIYTKLKDAKTVNVDLKRRGKPMTLDYAITP